MRRFPRASPRPPAATPPPTSPHLHLHLLAARLLDPRTRRTPLSPSGTAAAVTATYILPAGLAAACWPVPLFRLLFPLPATLPPTPWLRLTGLLAATFGVYYAGAALGEATPGMSAGLGFKMATAGGRLLLAAGLAALAATTGGPTGQGFAAFAALNAVGGLSMALALGRELARTT